MAQDRPYDRYQPTTPRGQRRGPGGGPGRGVGDRPPPQSDREKPSQEWPPKFEYQPGYFFEKEHLKESLLTTAAENQAYAFLHPNRQRALTSAQLRRFYHEVKALQAKIEAGGFEANAPLVKMLRSKVAYSCPAPGKGDRKIPDTFAEFLWKHIAQVRSKEDFDAFCTVFEAVVGFFYGQGGR
ncbi:MAG: type III-A CRISPR-associated protein Csm2 [Candidatus Binatia bacterium]